MGSKNQERMSRLRHVLVQKRIWDCMCAVDGNRYKNNHFAFGWCSLIPRPPPQLLSLFILQASWGGGLGTRLANLYVEQ